MAYSSCGCIHNTLGGGLHSKLDSTRGTLNRIMELYIIHIVFITACVGSSFYAGFTKGEKSGSQATVELFLNDKLITLDDINKNYLNK